MIGRKVLYRIGGPDEQPELRPALVVRTFPGGPYVNLQVFLDGSNDRYVAWPVGMIPSDPPRPMFSTPEIDASMAWRTSVGEGTSIGSWRRIGE